MRVTLTERERAYLESRVGGECRYAFCNCCGQCSCDTAEAAAERVEFRRSLRLKLAEQSTDDAIADYYGEAADEARDLSNVVTSLRQYAARWNRMSGVKAAIRHLDRLLESVRYVGD
jgi:hypothetical protein